MSSENKSEEKATITYYVDGLYPVYEDDGVISIDKMTIGKKVVREIDSNKRKKFSGLHAGLRLPDEFYVDPSDFYVGADSNE